MKQFRRSGRFLEAIAPRPRLHARGALLWLYGAYVLFVISLWLPVQRNWNWGLGRGGSHIVTSYGIQWMFFGLAGNMGFVAALFGGRTLSPAIVSWGLCSSIFGILQGLLVLLAFQSFRSVPLAGFWVWIGSLFALTVWFARFREKPIELKGPRVRWRSGQSPEPRPATVLFRQVPGVSFVRPPSPVPLPRSSLAATAARPRPDPIDANWPVSTVLLLAGIVAAVTFFSIFGLTLGSFQR